MKNKFHKSSTIPEIPISALEAAIVDLGHKPSAYSPEQGIAITKACIAEIEAELQTFFERFGNLNDDADLAEEHHSLPIRELRSLRLRLASYQLQKEARN
ncbi:MAG: hypothetical protein JWO95_3344 [Verrucomicrobiales bacterium]|nr:hypothetical protein [Verrucomicrobiales bacterium]